MGHTTSQASHGLVLECSFSTLPSAVSPRRRLPAHKAHRCWRHPGACSESQLIPGNLLFICSSQWIMSKSVAAVQWISDVYPEDKTNSLWLRKWNILQSKQVPPQDVCMLFLLLSLFCWSSWDTEGINHQDSNVTGVVKRNTNRANYKNFRNVIFLLSLQGAIHI